jgi:type I restriction enzyme S subunit
MSQSTRNQVPITTQRKFNLQLPEPKEQQKIASCLSAVDELITAQQEKIDELQQHKKGLMQGLFPKIV